MDNHVAKTEQTENRSAQRKLEEWHLADTIRRVEDNLERMIADKELLDTRVNELIQQYNPENVELYNELMVGLSLQSVLDHRIAGHRRAETRPYFARIDAEFDEEEDGGENGDAAGNICEGAEPQSVYIGKNGITAPDNTQLVTDWRAPIASLYYDAAPGRASYSAPGGEYEVELRLKRTFEIDGGELLDFYDTDVVANDELLIKYLGRNRDAALSDIVATIQRDQNRIIREEPWKNIIVQGAAGSGKTTVAMHRLAWITYNYRQQFKENEFYIIGGSNMFLHYITAMLPDLDVHDVRQLTFRDFLMKLLTDDDDRGFESFNPQPYSGDIAAKSSAAFANALGEWLDELQAAVFEPKNLELNGATLITAEDVRYVVDNRRGMSFSELADVLSERMEAAGANAREAMERFIESEYDDNARDILDDTPERRFGDLGQALAYKKKRLAGVRAELTKAKRYYKKRLPSKPVPTLYRQFLGWLAAKDEDWAETAKKSASAVARNRPDSIDLCMMLMIKRRLFPLEAVEAVKHLIVDEAQDYGESCYIALKNALNKCVFTVMGDIAQNIAPSGGLTTWETLLEGPFSDGRTSFFNLKKSYRNTIEISRFASRVLSKLPSGRYGVEPVIRHGEEPALTRCSGETELAAKAEELIRGYLADGMHTVAVVTRTKEEAESACSLLPADIGATLACDADGEYSGGVTVFPAEMVKGMEYDAVVVWNASSSRYTEEDGKLFYVVLTRAMHRLGVLYTGEPTGLLAEDGKTAG